MLMVGERTNANGSKAFREAMLAEQLGGLRRDRPRADPRRRAPDRPEHRLRGPRRRRGHGRAGRPAGHRLHAADHARLHRAGRCSGRAGAPRRPLDRQLGELRGRRRARTRGSSGRWRWSSSTAPRSSRCASTRRARRAPRDWKVRVAERLIARPDRRTTACSVEDIVVDSLTFPITTGQEEVRRDALETIEAIRELKRRHSGGADHAGHLERLVRAQRRRPAGAELGVPARVRERRARHRDRARRRRSCRWPRSPTSSARSRWTWSTTGRRARATTRWRAFMELFEGATAAAGRASRAEELAGAAAVRAAGAADRRRRAKRPGGRPRRGAGAAARAGDHQRHAAGGDEDGRRAVRLRAMQLPFVLQSAEVMKTAVAHLEPHMEKADAGARARSCWPRSRATCTTSARTWSTSSCRNNGYTVVNLGIKQPISTILSAAEEHRRGRHRHVRAAGQVHGGDEGEPAGDERPRGRREATRCCSAAPR